MITRWKTAICKSDEMPKDMKSDAVWSVTKHAAMTVITQTVDMPHTALGMNLLIFLCFSCQTICHSSSILL